MSKRYFCERCTAGFDAAGDCPDCKDEPLLDLSDPETMRFLEEQDDGKARRRYATFVSVGLLPAFAVFVATTAFVGWIAAMMLGAFAAMGCAFVLQKLFPAARKAPKARGYLSS